VIGSDYILSDFRKIIGSQYITNEGYNVEIIDYIDKANVLIKFEERPDLQIWSTLQNIKKGQVKYPYHKSVYGVGYYGHGKYSARNNNIKTEEYIKWFSMFVRCYDEKYQEKQHTYIGCSVSEDFCNFQNFAEWYNRNKYDCQYPLELDKDFLYEGNKVYSPSTCCLLPKEINNLINYKRHDHVAMKKLYEKYKDELPYYLRMELYKLTVPKKRGSLIMNYHNITCPDMNNGSGLRVVLWLSGCSHHCKDCQNPQTWDPESGIGFDDEAYYEMFNELEKDYISGLTLSGGDPLFADNIDMVLNLCKDVKRRVGKTIWLYTGYTYEEIMSDKRQQILNYVDVLVDGRYEEDKRSPSLPWVGSSNQRVIDVKESLKEGKVVLWTN